MTADLNGHLMGQTMAETIWTGVIHFARILAYLEMVGLHLGALEQITLSLGREKEALARERDKHKKEAEQAICCGEGREEGRRLDGR